MTVAAARICRTRWRALVRSTWVSEPRRTAWASAEVASTDAAHHTMVDRSWRNSARTAGLAASLTTRGMSAEVSQNFTGRFPLVEQRLEHGAAGIVHFGFAPEEVLCQRLLGRSGQPRTDQPAEGSLSVGPNR